MAVMGSPHGFCFSAKQAYHVLNPFLSPFLGQLAETKDYDETAERIEVTLDLSDIPSPRSQNFYIHLFAAVLELQIDLNLR